MKIGILSDTHDNLPLIRKAVSYFNQLKVGIVLHAGDYVAPFAVKELNNLTMPWQGVFGNNDGEKQGLAKVSEGRIKTQPLFLQLENKKIGLIHEPKDIEADIVIYGHTHTAEIKQWGKQIVINPGEAGGWISDNPTVAVLDLGLFTAEIVNL